MYNINTFANKNILLVCAETFSWPMHYVAQELRGICKKIEAIYIQPGEDYFSAPEITLFRSLNSDLTVHGMGRIAEEYIAKFKNAEKYIDHAYIAKIEALYTFHSGLNEQFLTEMALLPYYHDRDFYEYIDYNKILLYAQIFYQYLEKLFETNKPDVIIDCDVDFFGRSALLEVAAYHNVPYISIDHARIDGYILPTTSLVKTANPELINEFHRYLGDPALETEPNVSAMYDKTKKEIGEVPKIFKQAHKERQFNILRLLKQFIRGNIAYAKHFSFRKLFLNKWHSLSSPICSDTLKSLKFIWMYYVRRFYLHYSNTFEHKDLSKINYLYLPLHVIPESTTTVVSPYYINETFIIESISKSVRPDQYIVVKEHWSMIGYRPISYYKKIKRLPNVILIDPNYYSVPKDFILNTDMVVTISGSAALEASLLGKNSLIFGDPLYGMLSSAKKIHVDSNLRKTVREHQNYQMPEKEIYAYIKLLQQWGESINIKNLLLPPHLVDHEFVKNNIGKLLTVFSNGIALYEKGKLKNGL